MQELFMGKRRGTIIKIMNVKEALGKLAAAKDNAAFEEQLQFVVSNFTSEEDKAEIAAFGKEMASSTMVQMKNLEAKLSFATQFSQISDIISLAYIAKHYFGKTRSWLSQRINENIVNGKDRRLTTEEIAQFNFAIKDISEKLRSFSLAY